MAGSSARSGRTVKWIVVHTAEGILRADDLRRYFEASDNSSAHAVADDRSLLDGLVPYDRASWTLLNGNAASDNLELCGFARWSRSDWLSGHQGMLSNAAAWIRNRCAARGIPIRKLDAAAVARGEAGVIGHADYSTGTGDGDHWDPGPGFPWDIVIARATGVTPAPTPAPSHLTDDEETTMQLLAGDHRSLSFDIPAGATKIRVNCPVESMVVHGIWQAGDNYPKGTDFDYKWSLERDFTIDRLRPWVIDVAPGATQGSIIWTYAPQHPERTANLSFR